MLFSQPLCFSRFNQPSSLSAFLYSLSHLFVISYVLVSCLADPPPKHVYPVYPSYFPLWPLYFDPIFVCPIVYPGVYPIYPIPGGVSCLADPPAKTRIPRIPLRFASVAFVF